MPLLLTYLVKLSVSLAVMYLFYQLLLRRLTFYNWNRWYLLGYSIACFFIPLIDITGMINRSSSTPNRITTWIPSVESFTTTNTPLPVTESSAFQPNWYWLIIVIASVSICLFVRLLVQCFSLRRIRQKAQLVADGDVSLYHVALPIAPFSFGKAIFINPEQYSEAEGAEIIRHELVHVQQRHSADAVWSEVLCIVNWYNPFAWLIRKAMRQNLEFIADDHVLRRGMDKKAYQYLLLQTASHRQFTMANAFNFSSLKKRIAMMNKLKSTPMHLLKFLFVLPLMAVLVFACRQEQQTQEEKIASQRNELWFAGIAIDAVTEKPLSGVAVLDNRSGSRTVSDEQGYFRMAIPKRAELMDIDADFELHGYKKDGFKITDIALDKTTEKRNSILTFVYLASKNNTASTHSHMISTDREPTFELVHAKYKAKKEQDLLHAKIDDIVGNSTKPIWVIDGIPYAIGKGAMGRFDKEEVEDSPQFQVWMEGKVMSMEEANRVVNRFKVDGVGVYPRPEALKKYGVNTNLLLLKTKDIKGDWTDPKHYASK